ncbi:MAG: hypothetical protein ACYC2Y_08990 [Armatimonadota bacterium]
MFRFLILLLFCSLPACAGDLAGMVVGRTGDVLHVSLPKPVKDGSVLTVEVSGEKLAKARVLSCTSEQPYIALAKVTEEAEDASVPVGMRIYAEDGAPTMPAPKRTPDERFSIQAGAFYPTAVETRLSTGEYWQSYRLNYALVRANGLETLLSAEYARSSGETDIQVIPVTVLGKIKPVRMGSAHLFLGAGGGIYSIRSGGNETREFGQEFALGIESKHGWVLEARYRDVPDTQIKGYSLSFGNRF